MPDTQMKGDFSSILQSLLSNPQLLSSISSMIGASMGANQGTMAHSESVPMQREGEGMQREGVHNDDSISDASVPTLASPVPFLQNKTHNESKEKALLCALKPFLPSRKCEVIDSFIRILDIVSLVGGIK